MFPLSSVMQLPIGFGLGIVSAVCPGLLRPFILIGLVLLGGEGALLYQAGGYASLAAGLGWLVAVAESVALGIAGLGLGRWSGEIIFARS